MADTRTKEDARTRLAIWWFRHRKLSSFLMIAITIFFAIGLHNVVIKTIFSDLLPANHPFTQVFLDHPSFGSPLSVSLMVQNKDGTIYDAEFLQTVWDVTRDIDLAPAVNHNTVLSITTPSARFAEATPYGINMRPLMGDHPPKTQEEIAAFRQRLDRSPNARGFLVSRDETAAIVTASFIEANLKYGELFKFVQGLVKKYSDEDTVVYAAGQPMLTGWVYHYQFQMLLIFAVTIGALFLALFLYMRNVAGTVTPIVTGAMSAIWGFGFVGWLGYFFEMAVEPLLLLVPLLLVARAFSHTVQYTERYYEILAVVKDKEKAGELALRMMMGPGTLGILTDAFALFLIVVTPMPAMQRFAVFVGFWSLFLIPTAVFAAPLVLAVMPVPKNLDDIVSRDESESGVHVQMAKWLHAIAQACTGKAARVTGSIMLALGVVSIYYGVQIEVGNPVEGSSLLWHDSQFNVAVRNINDNFPGVNTLEIILDSKEDESLERTAQKADAVHTMLQLQDYMERAPNPPTATLSFADYMMGAQRLYNGGDPRWMPMGFTNDDTHAGAAAAMMGTGPRAFAHVMDMKQQDSTVSFWYPDNKEETVNNALEHARAAVALVGVEHENFTVRLGSGTIALQKAVNAAVKEDYWLIIGLLNLVMIALTWPAFRSLWASFILLVPVNMSNFVIIGLMSLMGVGLDQNTVLVAAVGVGVGIDYGIYLLARMVEEYDAMKGDIGDIINEAITTTGRAVAFTASIMLIGILPWYFLSGLKFLADMGMLLAAVMVINMVMALVTLPLLVWFIKPRFLERNDLVVTEQMDLRPYAREGAIGGAKNA